MTQVRQLSFRVDRSLYDNRLDDPRTVYGDLDQLVAPNLHHHYSGLVCAQRWLDVCEDPAYGHLELISRIDEVFPRFLQRIRIDGEPGRALALISLGPGDGAVDLCLLRHMDQQATVASYCGFDSSFELLRRAIRRIGFTGDFSRRFPIHVVCGDFTNPREWIRDDMDGAASRLFSLTGFTLGNFAERRLLSRIEALMRPDDYLFLDARTHELGFLSENERLTHDTQVLALGSYGIPSVRRFVFGPVEVATRATTEDVDIRLEVSRTLTTVPNAINMVISCEGLDSTMRFTGRPVRRDRLDLAVATLYRFEDLENWLAQSGFELVASEQYRGMAFFLLRRRESGGGRS